MLAKGTDEDFKSWAFLDKLRGDLEVRFPRSAAGVGETDSADWPITILIRLGVLKRAFEIASSFGEHNILVKEGFGEAPPLSADAN